MKKIIGLVGTNSDYSTNRLLLQFMASHFKQEVEMELIEIKDIPMFNKPASTELPQIVQDIADKIDEADGVVISTPEYDHAIPAVLMNALNWLSYGIFPFVDKPVMITGASYGVLGSSRAQSHLRQMLNSPELKARTMPGIEFLLTVTPPSSNAFSATLPVRSGYLVRRSTSMEWLSVPPETIVKPRSIRACANTAAFFFTCV